MFEETRTELVFYPGETRKVLFHLPPDPTRARQRWSVASTTTSCSCLAVDAGDEVVFDAGGATDLGVVYDAGAVPGQTAGSCLLRCKEAAGALCRISLGMRVVVKDYLVWPGRGPVFDLGAPRDGTGAWSLQLGRGDHPAAWRGVKLEADQQEETFALTADPEDARGIVVHAALRDPRLRGLVSERVKLTFSDAQGRPMAYAPIRMLRALVPGGLVAVPSTVLFGVVRADREVVRSAVLRLDAGTVIASLEVPDERFVAALVHDGSDLVLTVHFKADRRMGALPGDLAVHLEDGTIVRIPCLGAVVR